MHYSVCHFQVLQLEFNFLECVGAYLAVVLDEKLAELEGLWEKTIPPDAWGIWKINKRVKQV